MCRCLLYIKERRRSQDHKLSSHRSELVVTDDDEDVVVDLVSVVIDV